MRLPLSPTLTRRQLIRSGGAAVLAAALPLAPGSTLAESSSSTAHHLSVGPARALLAGERYRASAVLAYDGSIPGPTFRLRQGEPFRVLVENRLGEDTTVHWHGIRLPNAMDGVPGLTQPPIKSGASFSYDFTPPDAGTFWYHSHQNGLVQVSRGLAGAFIVDEAEPPQVDRELLWFIQDWRLDANAQIEPGFGNTMETSMAGRIGNTVTINGRALQPVPVRAGERIRLRIVNAAAARIIELGFTGHRPIVVALDGQPCEPHEARNGRVRLGPAMRADLILDMSGEPGSRHAVTDDFYGDQLGYTLTELAYDAERPLRAHPLDAPVRLPRNPLTEPDLATGERHLVRLQGGMMSGMGMGGGMMGMMGGMGGGSRAAWAIDGRSMTGDGNPDMPPLFTIQRGKTCILSLSNETAWWHPMHLHGHSFRVLTRDAVGNAIWRDTVLVEPRETVEIAFVADNPGAWMLHCHVLDHQVTGMMTVLRVT